MRIPQNLLPTVRLALALSAAAAILPAARVDLHVSWHGVELDSRHSEE